MSGPRWISERGLRLLHDESLAQHGGLPGIRDQGLLESALMRPQNLHAYEGIEEIPRLAASYAFGLAKNHPFNDGNKRAAFIACGVFLEKNGYELIASQTDAYEAMMGLAAGDISEEGFAGWIRNHSQPK